MNEESNVIRCRKDGLLISSLKCAKCDYIKWCSSQRKRQETIDQKNKSNIEKIKHIGIWLDKSDLLNISRDHYAIIDKRNSFWNKKYVSSMMSFLWKNGIPDRFEDSTCKTYTEEWCEEHRQDCLKNFDINMSRFDGITQERFENVLNFLKSSAPLQKVDDLSLCNCSGIYIMVLKKYRQLYIGQSKNIKERIKRHWYAKKEFELDMITNIFISEAMLIVPAFFMLLFSKEKVTSALSVRKMKWSTVFGVVAFTMASSPLITLVNLASQLFVENTVSANSEQFLSLHPLLLVFFVGVLAPVCEEVVFRGAIFGGMKKEGNVFKAILAS